VVAIAVVVMLLSGLTIGVWLQGKTPAASTAAQTQTQSQSQQGSAGALPPLEPPAAVDGVAPPDNPAPPAARRPPAAAPAPGPGVQPPAAAPAPIPPRVVGQLASPNPMRTAGCSGDKAGVIAKINTDGEPRAVALFSRGPDGAGKAVPMVKVGGGWIGSLGPYGVVGSVTWMVGVTDRHGVTVTGPVSTLPVVAC